MNRRQLYRIALRILIGAIGISAALGIYALLRQDLDEWSAKSLGTTLFVSAASFLIMINATGLSHRYKGYNLLSIIGVSAALVALPVFLYALWIDAEIWEQEDLWKIGTSLEISSIFTAHSSLLSLRRLPSKYRWLMPLATLLGAILASMVIWMIWGDVDGSGMWRATGVVSILLASATIIIPILPRLVALDEADTTPSRGPRAQSYNVSYCPNCGKPVSGASGKGNCNKCGAAFTVKF